MVIPLVVTHQFRHLPPQLSRCIADPHGKSEGGIIVGLDDDLFAVGNHVKAVVQGLDRNMTDGPLSDFDLLGRDPHDVIIGEVDRHPDGGLIPGQFQGSVKVVHAFKLGQKGTSASDFPKKTPGASYQRR